MPPLANVSAAEPTAGSPPMTATLRLRRSLRLDLLAVIRKRRCVKGELGVVWEWSNFGCSREECRSAVKDLKTTDSKSFCYGVDLRGFEPSNFASSVFRLKLMLVLCSLSCYCFLKSNFKKIIF